MDLQLIRQRVLRVLVVDDYGDEADSLALLLSVWGHRAFVAYDRRGALRMALAYRPDVALLDLGLPGGVDGCAIARLLREQPETAATLLVAVTGYGQERDCQRSREAGFAHFLLKPFEPAELGNLLTRYGAFVSLCESGHLNDSCLGKS
jgi:CheY-like chemotaxis protein